MTRQQERTAGRQPDEPLPAVVYADGAAPDGGDVRGRIVALDGEPTGRSFHFGTAPIVIGSDAASDVRVASAPDVARRHALVWMRGGRMMLRHVGGIRRKTLVGGRPADWVILDDGDEIQVGAHHFRAERVRPDSSAGASAERTTPAV